MAKSHTTNVGNSSQRNFTRGTGHIEHHQDYTYPCRASYIKSIDIYVPYWGHTDTWQFAISYIILRDFVTLPPFFPTLFLFRLLECQTSPCFAPRTLPSISLDMMEDSTVTVPHAVSTPGSTALQSGQPTQTHPVASNLERIAQAVQGKDTTARNETGDVVMDRSAHVTPTSITP